MEFDQSLFQKSRIDVRTNVFPQHISDVQQENIRGWVYDCLRGAMGPQGQPLSVEDRITYITRLNALFDANPIWLENIVNIDTSHSNCIVNLCVFGLRFEFATDFLIQLNPMDNAITGSRLDGIRVGWRTTPIGMKGRWSWLMIHEDDFPDAIPEISQMLGRYHTPEWKEGFYPVPSDAMIFQKMMANRFSFHSRGENMHGSYVSPVNTGDDTSDQSLSVS